MINEELSKTGAIILDAAICVHRELGPGLLESAYELALMYELMDRDLQVKRQFRYSWFSKAGNWVKPTK